MELRQTVEALVGPLAAAAGLELVLVECARAPGRWIVRIFVDRPEGGLTVGDCAGLSRGVGAALEAAAAVPGSFTLEVSSPGLDRPLSRPEDFVRFRGERVSIVTRGDGPARRRIEGILDSCSSDDVTVVTDDGSRELVRFEEMAKARRIADPWRDRGRESGRRGGRKGK